MHYSINSCRFICLSNQDAPPKMAETLWTLQCSDDDRGAARAHVQHQNPVCPTCQILTQTLLSWGWVCRFSNIFTGRKNISRSSEFSLASLEGVTLQWFTSRRCSMSDMLKVISSLGHGCIQWMERNIEQTKHSYQPCGKFNRCSQQRWFSLAHAPILSFGN